METDAMSSAEGVLYLVGTPIGNLEDMAPRALRILGQVDVIAAEDTRRTMALCNHFGIRKRIISYHEHNKRASGERIIAMLRSGGKVALVSDAGMPGFSDPGCELVDRCHREGIGVVPVPGPNAAVAALVCSGLCRGPFVFEGFLPRQRKRRLEALERLRRDGLPFVLYESPQRVRETLTEIAEVLPSREVLIARELTKLHEEIVRMPAGEAVAHLGESPLGEFVIVVAGAEALEREIGAGVRGRVPAIDPARAIEELDRVGVPRMQAIKALARAAGIPKRDLYSSVERDSGKEQG